MWRWFLDWLRRMGVKIATPGEGNEVQSSAPSRWTWRSYPAQIGGSTNVEAGLSEWTWISYPARVVIDDLGLPAGWFTADIGVSDPQGSASELSGVFTLTGGGPNPTSDEDGGFFVYQSTTSVVTITARIPLPTGETWGQIGLMVRDTLLSDDRRVTLFVTPAGHKFVRWRDTQGLVDQSSGLLNDVSGTIWLRIVVEGNQITTFESLDGINFTEIFQPADKTIPWANPTLLVGLYASNPQEGASQSGTLDNVTIAQPTGQDVVGTTSQWSWTSYQAQITGSTPVDPNTIYVATNGDDNNDGTIGSPVATVARARQLGGPILMRQGTYNEQVTLQNGDSIDGYPGEQATFRVGWLGNDANNVFIGTRIRFYGGDGPTSANFGTRSIRSVLRNLGQFWDFRAQIENCDGQSGVHTRDNDAFGCTIRDVVAHRFGTVDDGVDSSFGDLFDFLEGNPRQISSWNIHDNYIHKTGHNGFEVLGLFHYFWNNLSDQDWTDEYAGFGHRGLAFLSNTQRCHAWNWLTRGTVAAAETGASKEAKFHAANSAFYHFYMLSAAHVKCSIGAGTRSDPPSVRGLRFAHGVFANGLGAPVMARGWDDTPGLVWRDIQFKNCIFWNNRRQPIDTSTWDNDIYVNVNNFGGAAEFDDFQVMGCVFGPTTPRFRFIGFPGVTTSAQPLSYWEANYPNQFNNNQVITSDPFADSSAGFLGSIASAQANGAASEVQLVLNDAAAGFTSSSSQIVNAGVDLATTTADGENTTTIPVSDILWFRAARDGVPRQRIIIGNNPVSEVLSSGGGEIRVVAPVTFSNGDPINYEYTGSAPNIGPVQ